MYFVYILECADGTFYTGITNDLEKRVFAHNNLKQGAKYTKQRRPVQLVFSERKRNKGNALKRELKIKRMTREQKKSLISSLIA